MFGKRSPSPPAVDPALARRIQKAVEHRPAPKTPVERAPRTPLYKQGELRLGSGARIVVAIKNVSATGAMVEFMGRGALPDRVELVAPALRLVRPALVVWQEDGAAGLAFLEI